MVVACSYKILLTKIYFLEFPVEYLQNGLPGIIYWSKHLKLVFFGAWRRREGPRIEQEGRIRGPSPAIRGPMWRCYSRYQGTKSRTKIFMFRGFIDPSLGPLMCINIHFQFAAVDYTQYPTRVTSSTHTIALHWS